MSDKYRKELLDNSTKYEKMFNSAAAALGVKLTPQYKICIQTKNTGIIRHVFFVDFCDIKNKMVFEVDGGYHLTKQQQVKDLRRTRDISKLGYRVFRISNNDVLSGKSREFIISAYLFIGIDVTRKERRISKKKPLSK